MQETKPCGILLKLSQRKAVIISSIFLILLLPFYIEDQPLAYADDCSTSWNTNIDSNYNGPVFVNSYWTDQNLSGGTATNPMKKEIGPGDGRSTLAVVITNRNQGQNIISITGFLKVPEGIQPAGISSNPQASSMFSSTDKVVLKDAAVAHYDTTVAGGGSFTLFFDLNVSDKAKLGKNAAALLVNYFRDNQSGMCNSAMLNIPFEIPGRVVLDAVSQTTNLVPQKTNDIAISIVNNGTADATRVVVTILNLGNSRTTGSSGSSSSVVLQSSQTQLVNLGPSTFNIGTIPAHGKVDISTIVFPSSAASGSVQNVDLLLSYNDGYGTLQTKQVSTGLTIVPDPTASSLNIGYTDASSSILTAGKVQDLNFVVTNNGDTNLSDIVVSLSPQSSALSIIGDSRWTIQNMAPGESKAFSTQVFAGTNMIGSPTAFTVSANYITTGNSKAQTLNLGAFVSGDIKIQVYDISVNYVGNTPNIVGSILNQGSTTGLFTNIQLVSSPLLESTNQVLVTKDGSSPSGSETTYSSLHKDGTASIQPQFIGDLSANSPTPFSIPLGSIGQLKPGTYSVIFKITYADDLKNFHTLFVNGTAHYEPQKPSDGAARGQQRTGIMLPITAGIIGASVASVIIIKKKRSKPKNPVSFQNKDDDIMSLIDGSKDSK